MKLDLYVEQTNQKDWSENKVYTMVPDIEKVRLPYNVGCAQINLYKVLNMLRQDVAQGFQVADARSITADSSACWKEDFRVVLAIIITNG